MPLASDPTVRIEKLNIYNRKRVRIANAPVRRADFISDASGEVRFAQGAGYDNVSKLYYRDGRNQDWRLVNDEDVSGHREFALGFSPDGTLAHLQVERDDGPDLRMSWAPPPANTPNCCVTRWSTRIASCMTWTARHRLVRPT